VGQVRVGTERPAPGRRSPSVRIGVAVGWYDPENPGVWSGAPRAVVEQLQRLGVYGGHRNAFPWRPAANLARLSLRARGRLDDGWALSAEMRAVARLTHVTKRIGTPSDVDAWVQLLGGFGRIVRGRYSTISELSPSQIAGADQWWRSFGYPGAHRKGMEWVARQQLDALKHAHACCAISQWSADGLVRDGVDARKIHIVGYGRNVDIPAPADRDWSVPRFLFVGNDWRRKNGDAVVRAFARLRRELPAARLDLVSDHPEIDVEGVVGHGRLAKKGAFAVFDPDARRPLEELFAAATCFVLPSLIEPFGLTYVEAASAGIASIATTVGGTSTSVGEGGILVDPSDDDALLEAMRRMADPATARALGDVARQRAERLTWSAYGERVVRSLDLPELESAELAEFL
jgi:glycosyltransferase involved in cell wall biosynthesis